LEKRKEVGFDEGNGLVRKKSMRERGEREGEVWDW
jgi:hypothetical protein